MRHGNMQDSCNHLARCTDLETTYLLFDSDIHLQDLEYMIVVAAISKDCGQLGRKREAMYCS